MGTKNVNVVTRTTVYQSNGKFHARQYLYHKTDLSARVITASHENKDIAIKIRDERVKAALETGKFFTYAEMKNQKALKEKGLLKGRIVKVPWPEQLQAVANEYKGFDSNDGLNEKLIRAITDVVCEDPSDVNNQIIAKVILDLRRKVASQATQICEYKSRVQSQETQIYDYRNNVQSLSRKIENVPCILEVKRSIIFKYNVTITNPVTNTVILAYSTNRRSETTLKYILKNYDNEKYNLKNVIVSR